MFETEVENIWRMLWIRGSQSYYVDEPIYSDGSVNLMLRFAGLIGSIC